MVTLQEMYENFGKVNLARFSREWHTVNDRIRLWVGHYACKHRESLPGFQYIVGWEIRNENFLISWRPRCEETRIISIPKHLFNDGEQFEAFFKSIPERRSAMKEKHRNMMNQKREGLR